MSETPITTPRTSTFQSVANSVAAFVRRRPLAALIALLALIFLGDFIGSLAIFLFVTMLPLIFLAGLGYMGFRTVKKFTTDD